VDEGEGQSILLLHGNPTWSFLYRHIINNLKGRFRLIAPDYPGFGLSDRPQGYGYTSAEQAQVVKSLVSHLELTDLIIMAQDWGGPIGIDTALSSPDRIQGLVIGNTWCWPAETTMMRLFSKIMSTQYIQRKIIDQNFFVNRMIPMATSKKLSPEEMEHYRATQPEPVARLGAAEFPKQIIDADPWLQTLVERVPDVLGGKPLLLTWGMKDFGFPPKAFIPTWQSMFSDVVTVPLENAKHYIQENAPDQISDAIIQRFG
jgi:haloalkane dehalogenase